MGKTYLCNAFSLNMLPGGCHVAFQKIDSATAGNILSNSTPINAIGHAETDSCVRNLLEGGGSAPLPKGERLNVSISYGDTVIIAQYSGPRLPEGATTLPPGAKIEFWNVGILPQEF